MKINELLEELNKNYTKQSDCYQDVLQPFLTKYGCTRVKNNLEVDKHRWFETSIIVYKVNTDDGEKFFGVRAATDIFGESSGYDDIMWDMIFFEMIEKQEVTYEAVK